MPPREVAAPVRCPAQVVSRPNHVAASLMLRIAKRVS